jgi:hypothetical protein
MDCTGLRWHWPGSKWPSALLNYLTPLTSVVKQGATKKFRNLFLGYIFHSSRNCVGWPLYVRAI